jgi:hypothetical protein
VAWLPACTTTSPTTQQLLEDCARELRDDVIPAISDPTVIVNLQMMELVLQSCALRAGHEIAWMADEVAAIEAVEACLAADDKALVRRGIDLLQSRRSRETELRPNFYFPGRS